MAEQLRHAIRILRRKQVEDRTGLSRSVIYTRLDPKHPNYDPTFPKPIELGQGMKNPPVGWLESEVDSWLAAQVEKRDTQPRAEDASGISRRQKATSLELAGQA